MTRFKLAVAAGTVHLPRMHFVVAQAQAMGEIDRRLFACSVDGADLAGMPVTQNLPRLPMSFDLRRRTYPVADLSLGRSLTAWRPDAINLHFLPLGRFAARSAARLNVPLLSTVHAVEPFLVEPARTRRQRYLRDAATEVVDRTTTFLAVSDYIASWLRTIGVEDSRIRTQYIGIDTNYWQGSTPPEVRFRARRVVFVGHLTELKGVMDLLDASESQLAEHSHQVDVVGDGALLDRVREIAASRSNVVVHGAVTRDSVREILDAATVLVLPTSPTDGVEDAAPTVLAEAQAMGVPVIAYATGGTPEMVARRDCLVSSRRAEDLGRAIADLLDFEEAHYVERATEAREWVVRERSLRACADEVLKLAQHASAQFA